MILEAGTGGFSPSWSLVQPLVAEFTRVVSYDRAGYGTSDPVDRPRLPSVLARELHDFLQSAGIEGPFVLVGHSFGAMIVRMFARNYPDEAAGLVLVDATHEDEWSHGYPDAHRWGMRLISAAAGAMASLARLGIPHLLARIRLPGALPSLPPDARATILRHGFTRQTLHTVHRELHAMEESAHELRSGDSRLGNRPVVVITHGRAGARLPGTSADVVEEIERRAQASQRHLSRLSVRGELLVAGRSGHDIAIEEPGLVAGAIRTVVEAVRDGDGAKGSAWIRPGDQSG